VVILNQLKAMVKPAIPSRRENKIMFQIAEIGLWKLELNTGVMSLGA